MNKHREVASRIMSEIQRSLALEISSDKYDELEAHITELLREKFGSDEVTEEKVKEWIERRVRRLELGDLA